MSDRKVFWGDKRYYSLDYHLKKNYGEKLYKLSLNGGMTCPNRDGTLDTRGCIFCSSGGSGDFAADKSLSIRSQIENAKTLVSKKHTGNSYIAYFQAYTNTYAPCSYLEKIFTEAVCHPDIKALSIATRPDCLDNEILGLLSRLNRIKPVWVELGLQTAHEDTARFIRRGYALSAFEKAVSELRMRDIETIIHVILGLPGEDEEKMLRTIHYLNNTDIQGIKLHLLHILKDTDLAVYYRQSPFHVFSMDEYIKTVSICIANLKPDTVIHRLTGDGPRSLLIAPLWSANKRQVLNCLHSYLKEQDIWQGKEL